MTKNEALKMAIESLEQLKIFLDDELEIALYGGKFYNIETAKIKLACCENKLQVCAEALEQPADGIELEWYCKGWDDAEKDLATQEPKSPTILARLPNGTTVSNVYEAYMAGLKESKAETQEPVLVNATTHDGQTYKIEVSAPSREWVGLSDEEIEEVFNLGHKNFKEFASAIEAKLKEKNNG